MHRPPRNAQEPLFGKRVLILANRSWQHSALPITLNSRNPALCWVTGGVPVA